MRSIVFEGDTWEHYEVLRAQDKHLHRNLCRLIRELQRADPATGTGKPEALRQGLSGFWSRRISQKDRLICRYDDSAVCDRSHAPAWECSRGRSSVPWLVTGRWSGWSGVPTVERGNDQTIKGHKGKRSKVLGETQTEVVDPEVGPAPVADRHARELRDVDPGPAAQHSASA